MINNNSNKSTMWNLRTQIDYLTKEDVDKIDMKSIQEKERYKIWKRMPKVELHCHLDVCFSLDFFFHIIRKYNIASELSDGDIIDYFLYKDKGDSLSDFVTRTRRITEIYKNYDIIKELGKHAVYKKHKEGVVLAEFRFSPAYMAERYKLDFDKIFKAFKEGISEAVEELNHEIEAGLICVGEAGISRESLEECADFCIRNKKDLIGFDNAGYEVDLKPFQDIYERLRNEDINLTLHAGEDKTKPNLDNVFVVIEILKAKRIGHGIRVCESDELIKLVKEKNVLLEICPLSNVITNNVPSMDVHPIRKLYDSGVKVSVSSDDPGLFLKEINDEYDALYTHLNFNLKDFIKMNYWALEHSFLSEDVKQRVKDKYFTGFDVC